MEEFLAELNLAEKQQFELLRKIAQERQPKNILEIGSGWGLSAIAFLLDTEAKMLTIDARKKLEVFERRTTAFGIRNRIKRVYGRSGPQCKNEKYHTEKFNLLEGLKKEYDLIYIDGSHEYKDVHYDLKHSLNLVVPGGTIILDDYLHKSNYEGTYGVYKAVAQLAKDNYLSYKVYPNACGIIVFDF